MRTKFLLILILILSFKISFSQSSYTIAGVVVDSTNKKPLEYVNIGIFQKNIGTVSNNEGTFEIVIPFKHKHDSLLFSSIGYKTKRVFIPDLLNRDTNKVFLKPKRINLDEVKIISKKYTQKVKGNKTSNESIGLAISQSLGYGSEIGTLIKLPDKEVLLKDFNFHIYFNRPDSALFRLKIYSYNNGIDTLLVNENIIFMIKNHYTGDYKKDLLKYHIVVNKDIFVSIECLKEYTHGYDRKVNNDKFFYDRIIISAKLLGSKSFVREVSQGKWIKPEMSKSPGFWLNVLY